MIQLPKGICVSAFQPSAKLRPILSDPTRPFIHRDLSWLQFNERVLSEATQKSNPLLERLKFLSISSSNIDEFFMIRMGSLRTKILSAHRKRETVLLERLSGLQSVILSKVQAFIEKQTETVQNLASELAPYGIHLIFDPKRDEKTLALAKQVFESQVLLDLPAPEPFTPKNITSLNNHQIAVIADSGLWLTVPKKIRPVLTHVENGEAYFFFLDQLLSLFGPPLLSSLSAPLVVRMTRDGDFTVEVEEEDSESIPDLVRTKLGTREQGKPTRLQYFTTLSGDATLKLLRDLGGALKISANKMLGVPKTFCFSGLWSALNTIPQTHPRHSELVHPVVPAHVPLPFNGAIFDELKRSDLLLHHPYDSFDAYVKWIKAACEDPAVKEIFMTVYRMDALSPVVELLKKAATTKKVCVVIELRARFDELNNLHLADDLIKSNVKVTFGFGKLKVHAKVTLVTRVEDGVERRYTHLSTGNYHSVTARQYTDLAILTSDPVIGEDAKHFFDSLQKNQVPMTFKKLVAAPLKLHKRMLQLIDHEIEAARSGKNGRIVVKVNSLVDEAVAEKLYTASQAGVKIDLIVRGACSLIPGLPGLSENIRVISIVDRFLEHSRIYYFENAQTLYLSSADWMPRNFFSRQELAFPVLDPRIYRHITEVVLPAYLSDTEKARELGSDGTWKRPKPSQGKLRSQFYLHDLSLKQYKGTPLEEIIVLNPTRPS